MYEILTIDVAISVANIFTKKKSVLFLILAIYLFPFGPRLGTLAAASLQIKYFFADFEVDVDIITKE